MKREKYLKKISLYFVLSMILVVPLMGCERKVKLKSDRYREWVDAIGINEYPHVSCWAYYEYANGVELYISDFNYETADEFKKIIDNHNAFVTRKPDYFSEDFDINIIFIEAGGKSSMRFSNRTDSDLDKGTTRYMFVPWPHCNPRSIKVRQKDTLPALLGMFWYPIEAAFGQGQNPPLI